MFGTIPAGIYAKTHYNSILANVDYLHGSAESLLTITNLLIGTSLFPGCQSSQLNSSMLHTDQAETNDCRTVLGLRSGIRRAEDASSER